MWRLSSALGNLKFEYLSLASQHLHPLSLKYLLHTVVTLTTVTCLTSIHSLHRHRSFTVSTTWSNLLPFCGCLPDLGYLPTWPMWVGGFLVVGLCLGRALHPPHPPPSWASCEPSRLLVSALPCSFRVTAMLNPCSCPAPRAGLYPKWCVRKGKLCK